MAKKRPAWWLAAVILATRFLCPSFALAEEEFGVFDRDRDTAVVMPVKNFSDYKIFTLSHPYRIVVDISTNDARELPTRQFSSASPRIEKIRTSLREGLYRFVIEPKGQVGVAYHGVLEPFGGAGGNDRIVMMTLANTRAAHSAPAETAARILGIGDEGSPFATPQEGVASSSEKSSAPVPVRKPGTFFPLIVVDAGHGGKDPGARGAYGGSREKEVTLAFAKSIARTLAASGRYKARLTREGDEYIPLIDRVRVAERLDADFFLSVHADSIPSKPEIRGMSVYTLSDTASDAQTAALAQKENMAGGVASSADAGLDADVAGALFRLGQRETMNRSALFSENLLGAATGGGIELLRNPHRFAGFRVLTGVRVPSALVELGFLSNASDEKLLRSDAHRRRMANVALKTLDTLFYSNGR
ncbi:MAG: N-acetylmuramoyl-L-alanine amidase [Rickettsiales bacterium]